VKVVWQALAETELDAAVDYYYFQASATISTNFRNEVERVTKLLCEHAKVGVQVRHNARRLPLHGYPFDLVYRARQDSIIVVALAR